MVHGWHGGLESLIKVMISLEKRDTLVVYGAEGNFSKMELISWSPPPLRPLLLCKNHLFHHEGCVPKVITKFLDSFYKPNSTL